MIPPAAPPSRRAWRIRRPRLPPRPRERQKLVPSSLTLLLDAAGGWIWRQRVPLCVVTAEKRQRRRAEDAADHAQDAARDHGHPDVEDRGHDNGFEVAQGRYGR